MCMGSLSCAVLAALLVLTGCAQGSSGNDSGTARTDSTVIPGRDTSVTPRDTGSIPPACTDDAHGSMCERATDLGSLMAGDSITPDPGVLPMSGDEDWFRVDFPPDPMMNMPGGGMPAIEFVMNGGEAFRFEVRGDCMTTLGCGDGMSARDVDSWSFVDDQAMMGEDAWSTRDAPWPAAAVIRVYRPVGMGDCQRYQIRVSR
jgi:hypothetical protein